MMPGDGAEGGSSTSFFIMMLLMIVVFYFFMIRPQMRKSKEQKKFRESLTKGAKIITIGGIHGKILEVRDTTLIIETEGQGRLKIEKSAAAADNTSMMPEQQQK
ncbi:MAG: preprotein translocase subunit YajC [Clostridia bacterium]|nr:preprotein translocase subunit YajC [Clostridia bacterium]